MKVIGCILAMVMLCSTAVAEVQSYSCLSVTKETVGDPTLQRMKAHILVPDSYLLSQKDLIDTAKAAAVELIDQSQSDVVIVKIYPTEAYAQYFPQLLDLTYAPHQIGWNGKPSATWVAFIADDMPDEKEMFKISTWILEQTKNQKALMERKKAIAEKLDVPIDDVYFPIFSLIPCVMQKEM